MIVKFVCEDKYKPEYANQTDACMDIKAKITEEEFNQLHLDFLTEDKPFTVIEPGKVVKLHTGLQAQIPEGHVMKVYVRSSIGIKKNLCLANGTGIIDAGYRDEIIIALYNFGKECVRIYDGDRICQFVILPYPKIEPVFVQDDNDFRQGDRGGGIGSTGA